LSSARLLAALSCLASAACLGPTFPPPDSGTASTPVYGNMDADPIGSGGNSGSTGNTGSSSSSNTVISYDAGTTVVRIDSAVVNRDAAVERYTATDAGSPSALFGFENASPDWTSSNGQTMRDTNKKSEGDASLMFVVNGGLQIRSRAFDTNELSGTTVTSRLAIDVYTTAPQGNINLTFECQSAKLGGTGIGNKQLNNLPLETWNQLVFDLPTKVVQILQGSYTGCKLWMDHSGQGVTRYDRLTFVP
jgi:hypothetical protein